MAAFKILGAHRVPSEDGYAMGLVLFYASGPFLSLR